MKQSRSVIHGIVAALDEEERHLYLTNAAFKMTVDEIASRIIPLLINGAKNKAEEWERDRQAALDAVKAAPPISTKDAISLALRTEQFGRNDKDKGWR